MHVSGTVQYSTVLVHCIGPHNGVLVHVAGIITFPLDTCVVLVLVLELLGADKKKGVDDTNNNPTRIDEEAYSLSVFGFCLFDKKGRETERAANWVVVRG